MKLKKIEKVDELGFKEVYHVDEQGRKQDKYIKYRHNGSKLGECNYKDDNLHGQYIEYYPDGSKWYERGYKDGASHGKYIEYCKNGIKSEERIFKDGNILKSTYYNEKGQKVEERKYFYPEEGGE